MHEQCGMQVALSRTDIGLLAQLRRVLSRSPLRPLVLASPPFGGVGALGAPPFVFLSFSFPSFLPSLSWEVHAASKKVREYEPTVGNHIGSSACEFVFDES